MGGGIAPIPEEGGAGDNNTGKMIMMMSIIIGSLILILLCAALRPFQQAQKQGEHNPEPPINETSEQKVEAQRRRLGWFSSDSDSEDAPTQPANLSQKPSFDRYNTYMPEQLAQAPDMRFLNNVKPAPKLPW